MPIKTDLKERDPVEALMIAIDEFVAWHSSVDLAVFGENARPLEAAVEKFIVQSRATVDEPRYGRRTVNIFGRKVSDLENLVSDDKLLGIHTVRSGIELDIYLKSQTITDTYIKFVQNIEKLCSDVRAMKPHNKEKSAENIELGRRQFVETIARQLKEGLANFAASASEEQALLDDISSRMRSGSRLTIKPLADREPRISEKTTSVTPPTKAPATYAEDRRAGENVVDFIKRVYGERGYLTGEFTRADLRRIDPSAATALNNWEKGNKTRPKGRAPLNLPTVKELNDRYVAEGKIVTDDPEETARRAAAAVYRQKMKLNL